MGALPEYCLGNAAHREGDSPREPKHVPTSGKSGHAKTLASLLHSFDTITVHVYELVRGNRGFNLGPNTLQPGGEITTAHIAYAQMDDPRWRFTEHDALREVRILGYNGQVVLSCVIPKARVGGA